MRSFQTTVCQPLAVAISTILMLGALPASATIPNPKTASSQYFFEAPFYYEIEGDQITIISYLNANNSVAADVTIPKEINGLPVTKIGTKAFVGPLKNVASVTIPEGVTEIGYEAFSGCINMTSISIPNSVTSIGIRAFRRCYSLKSVTIPSNVTAIQSGTFYQCTSLATVTIPNGVTNISHLAFYQCTSLTSVALPDTVTRIKYAVFADCTSLASVTIPTGVTRIGKYAFRNCHSLTSVEVPSSVTGIAKWAFIGSGLHSVYFKGNAPAMPRSAFSNNAADFTVYFLNANHGFTVPTWKGYPSVGLETFPAQEISIAGNFSADSATDTRSSKISVGYPFTLLGSSTLTAPAIFKGKQLIDGCLYLTLSYQNSSATGTPLPTVEVSSDLMDWYSGDDHTVTVVANNGFVTVRDKTATSPQAKRYIRLKPSAD